MTFVWFWTFWHWSKESFRNGALLRNALHGISGHWDEWYRHEASEGDHLAIARTGTNEAAQRQFIDWLLVRWAREAGLGENHNSRHFALGQLAHVQPFNQWAAFEKYRKSYGSHGISALVLTEGSAGEPEDIRAVEALALPEDDAGGAVLTEGFQADGIELETSRRATLSALHGRAFLMFFLLWLVGGERPYPRWLRIVLALGWSGVGALIIYLLVGSQLEEHLYALSAILVILWSALTLVAFGVAAVQGWRAWRQGRAWANQLEKSQLRLRMNGGLTVKGGSAGLSFCLNTLLAVFRADPLTARGSWLWRRLFNRLRNETDAWAATGVITSEGSLKPVVLEPKLRACLQREGIRHILTPKQPEASQRMVTRIANTISQRRRKGAPDLRYAGNLRLGFAAEEQTLRVHRCGHVAQALISLGGFADKAQVACNILGLSLTLAVLVALPDLRNILAPPPVPVVVLPSSPIVEDLWVSLDTKHPECFVAMFESGYWLNRKAEVLERSGANGSTRAEISLRPAAISSIIDQEDGVVWIERRYRFLGREFEPGERVGRYGFSYLAHLGHE
jgi:hypothetical protein